MAKAADFLSRQFRNALPRIFPKPPPWSEFRRNFKQKLIIGIVIGVLVQLAGHWHVAWVVDIQNTTLDTIMKLSAGSHFNDRKPHSTQVFFDVDEQTYRNPMWGGGEPSILPLEQIAVLVESAFRNHARYVLVDFAIDGPRDERQDKFISRIESILKEHPEGHLLFVRTLRQPLGPALTKSVRPSALDALISLYPGKVHAVAPNFVRSSDKVLRHWRLWESACYRPSGASGDGKWVIVPSPQLMIASLEKKRQLPLPLIGQASDETQSCIVDGAKPAHAALKADWLAGRWVLDTFHKCYQQDSFTKENCSEHASTYGPQAQKKGASKREDENLANRILFRQPDSVRKHAEAVWQDKTPAIVTYAPYFDRLPAINLLVGASSGPTAVALKKLGNEAGTIAIIGASYGDSRDTHLTPLGEMPGSLVLVNAIDTLQNVGILQSPNFWSQSTVIVLSIIIVSAVFAWLSAFWASVFMIALVVLTMGPLSLWFLKQGIWLDFGAPIIGIYLHREWEGIPKRLTGYLLFGLFGRLGLLYLSLRLLF